MKDTPPAIERKFRRMLMKLPGAQRLKMGCSMHATARALVVASIAKKDVITVRRELFLRFYRSEFESKKRTRILRALREAADANGKSVDSGSDAVRRARDQKSDSN